MNDEYVCPSPSCYCKFLHANIICWIIIHCTVCSVHHWINDVRWWCVCVRVEFIGIGNEWKQKIWIEYDNTSYDYSSPHSSIAIVILFHRNGYGQVKAFNLILVFDHYMYHNQPHHHHHHHRYSHYYWTVVVRAVSHLNNFKSTTNK